MTATALHRPDAISASRVETVDIVKGIAVYLMVLGHTAQGMWHRGWWVTPAAGYFLRFLYSFHMAAFFFVSGLFALQSLDRRGPSLFLMDKLRTLLYPYLLWALLNHFIEPFTDRYRVSGVHDWPLFFHLVWTGQVSWFLITLFTCMMLVLATWKLTPPIRFALALAMATFAPNTGIIWIDRPAAVFPLIAAGIWVGLSIRRLERFGWIQAILTSAALFLFQAYLNWRWPVFSPIEAVYAGLNGAAALVFFSRALDLSPLSKTIAWFGRGSLAVFLISSYFQGIGREFVLRVFHTTALWPQLFVPSFCALIFPALFWHLCARFPALNWFLFWPRSNRATGK